MWNKIRFFFFNLIVKRKYFHCMKQPTTTMKCSIDIFPPRLTFFFIHVLKKCRAEWVSERCLRLRHSIIDINREWVSEWMMGGKRVVFVVIKHLNNFYLIGLLAAKRWGMFLFLFKPFLLLRNLCVNLSFVSHYRHAFVIDRRMKIKSFARRNNIFLSYQLVCCCRQHSTTERQTNNLPSCQTEIKSIAVFFVSHSIAIWFSLFFQPYVN
jgi:hypothetical protein